MENAKAVFTILSMIITYIIQIKLILLNFQKRIKLLKTFHIHKDLHFTLFLLIQQFLLLTFLKLLKQLSFIIIKHFFGFFLKIFKLSLFLLLCKPYHNRMIYRKVFYLFKFLYNFFTKHTFYS